MTCIVAIKEDDAIYIGGDRAASDYSTIMQIANSKVFRNKAFVFGISGSFRYGEILENVFVPPKHPPNVNIRTYMATFFTNTLRECMRDSGAIKTKQEIESPTGSSLVAYSGHLFALHGDFSVQEYIQTYNAMGSGYEVAIGSLHTTDQYKIPPKERIRLALEAASEHTPHVCPPFDIIKQKNQQQN